MTIHTIIQPHSKKLLFLTLTLLLVSCSEEPPTDAERGINTARETKHEIVLKYLQCYALHPSEKSACTNLLNDQYPNNRGKESQEYINSYMYEAEKLGFRYFLTENLKLQCRSIEVSPLFVEAKQAYLVKCKPRYEYLMRFDYDSKEWQLILENNQAPGDHHE